jgi:hypothetical protein
MSSTTLCPRHRPQVITASISTRRVPANYLKPRWQTTNVCDDVGASQSDRDIRIWGRFSSAKLPAFRKRYMEPSCWCRIAKDRARASICTITAGVNRLRRWPVAFT